MFDEQARPLRIGYYLSGFPVISQTFILRQIAGLLDRGHDVEILAESKDASGIGHATVVRHRMMERAVFAEVPRLASFPGMIHAAKACSLWAMRNPTGFVSALSGGFRQKLKREMVAAGLGGRRRSYDGVIAHFGPTALSALSHIDRGMISGPLFPVFHGYDMTRFVMEEGPDVYADLFAKSEKCLAISRRWADRLIDLGCPSDKVLVSRVGIDVSDFPYSPRTRRDGRLKLLTVARLVEKKGVEFAIRSISELQKSHEVDYTVIGDGPLTVDLKRLVSDLGLSDSVTFAGALPEQAVRETMEGSDALLVPSVVASDGDEEGIPVVIMEAMCLGLPVIASRHSGIPELVTEETGFLVPEKDTKALAKAIMSLSSMSDTGILTASARERVERLHSGDRLCAEIESMMTRAARA